MPSSYAGFHFPDSPGPLQQLMPDSWECEELFKLLSSSYLDASSRGAFTYTKACHIHNELLEKQVRLLTIASLLSIIDLFVMWGWVGGRYGG